MSKENIKTNQEKKENNKSSKKASKEKRGIYKFRVEKEDYPKLEKIYQALKGDWSNYTEKEMLVEKRILAGLTPKDVADALGVRSELYSKWEASSEEEPFKLSARGYAGHDEVYAAIKNYIEIEYDITRYMMSKSSIEDPVFNVVINLDWEDLSNVSKKEEVDLKKALGLENYQMLVEEYGCAEEAQEKQTTVTEVLKGKLDSIKKLGYVTLTPELRARVIRIVQLTERTIESVCMDFGVCGSSETIRLEQKEIQGRRVLC